ncbi:MAG: hypothetical protein ACWGSQ_04025 [Longimicrobiales bacterium]
MEVHAFLRVVFQTGSWKQGWPESGRITYKATQEHASLEILKPDGTEKLHLRVPKGTKVLISGNSIHLPDSIR